MMILTPTKSHLLQLLSQKNEDQVNPLEQSTERSPQRSKWMRKLNILSPSKLHAPPPSPTHLLSPIKMNPQRQSDFTDAARKYSLTPKRPLLLHTANESLDVIDLEKVINDFEKSYMSPTKRDDPSTTTNKFVKKMVAIFEKKTVTSNKNSKNINRNLKQTKSSPIIKHEDSHDYFIPVDNNRYIIPKESRSLSNSPVNDPEWIVSECHNALDEEISFGSIDSAEEASESMDGSLYEFPPARSDASLRRERAPTIIGAFLKKPIEVENTTIDWLPTPATKLPRKKSFTKFFSLLTGKKLWDNRNKSSVSREKFQTEPKESHDSGYDEKSISQTSSLKSTSSFKNTLTHEENNLRSTDARVTRVSTFQTSDPSTEKTEVVEEILWDNNNINDKKKIMFDEIPRSEVRLSLGPFFPIQPKLFIKSADKRDIIEESSEEIHRGNTSSNIKKYQSCTPPSVSPLPKHPFISKDDRIYDSPIVSLDDDEFNQVELRRAPKWKFPSLNNVYSLPKYFPVSEPGLFNDSKNNRHSHDNLYENVILYDLPRVVPPRPKSSVYEDAQSLKRRIGGASSFLAESQQGFYGSPAANKRQFATIKPRTSTLLRNREFLSTERFKMIHTLTIPSNHDYSCNYSEVTEF